MDSELAKTIQELQEYTHSEWCSGETHFPACTLAQSLTALLASEKQAAYREGEIDGRIDETKRWMPISPDPHSSIDMQFVEAGKQRLAELSRLRSKQGEQS